MTLDCNNKKLKGYWEQKGDIGTFVTNDKSIYGVFKKTKFDYLGTYLLPKNTYTLATAKSIYDTVRSEVTKILGMNIVKFQKNYFG